MSKSADIIMEVDKIPRLKRKIDEYLIEWKNSKDKMSLIVKGARQVGKTDSVENFAKNNYKHVVEINFALQKEYKTLMLNAQYNSC